MAERASASSEFLVGLLALERGLIDQSQLVAAFQTWRRAGDQTMSEVLVDLGAIAPHDQAMLDRLLTQPLRGDRDLPSTQKELQPGRSRERIDTVAHVSPPAEGQGTAPPGDVVRYRVLRLHARGGLGEVFRALDPELNREVALKELPANRAHDSASQTRFLLEAEITGRLEHPGIVPVYGLGRYADGRPYYAMRLIEGETLRAAIDRFHGSDAALREPDRRELAFRRLLRSIIDTCNAVAYAHSRGVVHRDLKPENIMLGRFGETLVLDWGIAKPIAGAERAVEGTASLADLADASLTLHGAVLGTPRFMSPEQAAGQQDRVGPATDVYGLGATLYCLLAGRPPFPDGEIKDVLRRVRRGIFPAPSRLKRGTDRALEAICLKAMALRPEDRHESALALAADLESWLADLRYRAEQQLAFNQARRTLARLCFERAQNMFTREMHPQGMLWLARALENVPQDSPDLDRAIRASLGGWYAGARSSFRSLPHRGAVRALAFDPDGRRLATGCDDGTVRLWDVATGTPLLAPLAHAAALRAIVFGNDGQTLTAACSDGTHRRWDSSSGAALGEPSPAGEGVVSIHLCGDGSALASLTRKGALRLWDGSDSRTMLAAAEGDRVRVYTLAPDGRKLATTGADGHVHLWETRTGAPVCDPLVHERHVDALEFSADGLTLLTICHDGTTRIWNLDERTVVVELAHRGEVQCARFSPSGAAVATGCGDGTARLWDARTGSPIGEPLEHRTAVDLLQFSNDGTLIASASHDGMVRLWDAATALPIGPPLAHPSAILAMVISPDGQRLATAGSHGLARCWKIPDGVGGDPERISCWVRVTTGLEFDPGDAIRPLDHLSTWELRRRLQELGGAPVKKH